MLLDDGKACRLLLLNRSDGKGDIGGELTNNFDIRGGGNNTFDAVCGASTSVEHALFLPILTVPALRVLFIDKIACFTEDD